MTSKRPGVGRRVRARRAPDRRLVDLDDLVERVEPQHGGVARRPLARAVQAVGHRLEQHLVDQRRLARARHAGHAGQHAERDVDVERLEVVLLGARISM
jgi:hypothetical protein